MSDARELLELVDKNLRLGAAFCDWNDMCKKVSDYLSHQPETKAEPVAWKNPAPKNPDDWFSNYSHPGWIPLYAELPRREPLSRSEINRLYFQTREQETGLFEKFARGIERTHGIGVDSD